MRFLFLLITLLIISCGDEEHADLEFFIEERFVLPAGLNTIETHVFVIEDVYTLINGNLASKGYTLDQVETIGPGRATLTSDFSRLNFLREVSIRVVPKNNPAEYKELFMEDNVLLNEDNSISLFNTLVDITEEFSAEQVDIEVRLQLRSFSPAQLPLTLRFSYAVFINE